MAVVAFLNGGDLFGAGNANEVLAHNIGTHGNQLQLANTRTIAFTPIAGTMKGVVLAFNWGGQPAATTVTVKLQQNIAGTWTDVVGTTKVATSAQITRTCTTLYPLNTVQGQFDYYFEFPTPAVVTAVANTWRIDVTTASGNPFLWTSDNTNPFFVAVGTGTTTFVTNQDQPIITNSQPVTFTQDVRFLGILPTGATRGVCGFLGSGVDGLPANVKMLNCYTNNVTVTLNGIFAQCTFSAPSFGTEATPLSGFVLRYDTATVGTANLTGFNTVRANADTTSGMQRLSFYLYGTVPSLNCTYMTANAAVGATSIEVEDTTGWVNGDKIDMGGQTTRGIGDTTDYTVTSTSGKTINFTPALAAGGGARVAGITGTLTIASPCVATWSSSRGHGLKVGDAVYFRTTGALPTGITAGQKYYVVSVPSYTTFTFSDTLGGSPIATSGTQSGTHTICVGKYAGRVIKMNGYGARLTTDVSGGVQTWFGAASIIKISGVQINNTVLTWATDNGRDTEYVLAWTGQHVVKDCSYEFSSTPTVSGPHLINIYSANTYYPGLVKNINARKGSIISGAGFTPGANDEFNFEDNIQLKTGYASGNGYNIGVGGLRVNFRRNHIENSNIQLTFTCAASLFEGNRFWGCSTSVGFLRFNTVVNTLFKDNIYDNSSNGLSLVSTCVGSSGYNNIYGALIANTTDINFLSGFLQYIEESPLTTVVPDESSNSIARSVIGSEHRIANFLPLLNDNRTWQKYGKTQSAGTGLTDTIARTAGGYSLRCEPNSGTGLFEMPLNKVERIIPTGNIQNKTMNVNIWVYIANSAYAAGTHVKPTLNVKYDNTTTVSAVAGATYGAWQQLSVTFTPLTAYGQIEWWITASTDATGTNRYFYLDDITVNYPAGVSINLGGMDLWASALPVFPPIATFPSLGGIWDEATSAHTIAGSFGVLAKDTEVKADDSTVFNLIQ